MRLPSSFLPDEDQGSFMAMVILPQGTPQSDTMALVKEVERYMLDNEPRPELGHVLRDVEGLEGTARRQPTCGRRRRTHQRGLCRAQERDGAGAEFTPPAGPGFHLVL
ncbi:hypothetical protein G6F57_022939 [Rhizopus arrhizus]|nr:hypothetical protein G6F57_022939 [Rhizopus arrhizus]